MKTCPICRNSLPEWANYCSQCRCDFAAIEAQSEAEGVWHRAEGDRAVRHFALWAALVVSAFVILFLSR